MKYNFEEWKFRELSAWMDGGSMTLNFIDQNDQIQIIEVVQNMSVYYIKEISKIPGRIYVNNVLIGKRSTAESKILEQLKTSVKYQQDQLDKQILEEKIDWIESNEYLEMIPILTELSEKRKQNLLDEGRVLQDELTLRNVEHQFYQLRKEKLNIKEFETWIYQNELSIKEQYSASVYDDLILLNYNNDHAKYDLAKILEIDYRKLELYELRRNINSISNTGKNELNEISHDLYDSIYDPHSRVLFRFKIGKIRMGINYPFLYTQDFTNLSKPERNLLFKEQFKKPIKFLKIVLEKVESNEFRIVVLENLESVDNIDYTETICGSKDDIMFYIGKQRILMNKEVLKLNMKRHWC